MVNVTEPVGDPDNNLYIVEDELIINLSLIDESNRAAFVLPRFMFYRVVLVRDIGNAIALPKKFGGLFSRLMPVKVAFGSVGVANTLTGGSGATNITIKVNYQITNETYNQGKGFENLTLRIFTMGFLPGNINGIGGLFEGKLPIIDFKAVSLDIDYDEKPAEL